MHAFIQRRETSLRFWCSSTPNEMKLAQWTLETLTDPEMTFGTQIEVLQRLRILRAHLSGVLLFHRWVVVMLNNMHPMHQSHWNTRRLSTCVICVFRDFFGLLAISGAMLVRLTWNLNCRLLRWCSISSCHKKYMVLRRVRNRESLHPSWVYTFYLPDGKSIWWLA